MKIGFFVCSNGYGHFMRVSKIANQLKEIDNSCEIDIFCEQYHIDKFQSILVDDFNYIPYKRSNINWNTYLGGIRFDYDEYMKWLSQYKDVVNNYDVVVSDNIVGLLKYRNDIILSSSFLWHDIMIDKFSNNPDVLKLYEFEQNLLTKYKPNMLCVKEIAMESIKYSTNPIYTGWCCDLNKLEEPISDIENFVFISPSLGYDISYTNTLLKMAKDVKILGYNSYLSKDLYSMRENNSYHEFNHKNFKKMSKNSVFVFRPGVGTITDCIQYNSPMILVYSENDSKEILHLVTVMEDIQFGLNVLVNSDFDKLLNSFDMFRYKKNISQAKKNGHYNSAKYILDYYENI
jgi:hypothetical protein